MAKIFSTHTQVSNEAAGAQVGAGPLSVCKTPTPGGPIPLPYANMIDALAASGDPTAKQSKKKLIKLAGKRGFLAKSATAVAMGDQTSAAIGSGLLSQRNQVNVVYGGSMETSRDGTVTSADMMSVLGVRSTGGRG